MSSSGKNHPFCGWLEVFARDKEARVQTSKKARDAVQERQERSKRGEDVENCIKNASVRLGVTGESESSEARSLRVTQANILENFRLKRGVNGREIFRAPNVSVRVQETEREAPRGTNVAGDVRVGAERFAGDIARAEGGRESRSVDGVEEEEEDGAAD